MTRHIAIDIETSGFDPEAGFEIIRICAVELLDGGRLGANFQSLVKPLRPLIPLAEELTGITNEMLAEAPRFADIASDFLDFVAGAELVCINGPFDSAFLNRALAYLLLPAIRPERFVDLLTKIPFEFREQGSEGLYNYVRIERNPAVPPSHEVARLYWTLIAH